MVACGIQNYKENMTAGLAKTEIVGGKMSFRKTTLSSSIALVVAGMSSTSLSQDELEEIVVEGIRGSLKRSMDVKRDSMGVVDAITAEDIGKFPDTNLAEALQRITGVSIARERGEGSSITVRGFGPEYNLVTFNGRQLPTHNRDSRSFDFGNIAAEGISGVQVYKTGRADVPTGGIGSLVNISTTRPLDAPGETATFTIKAKNDPSAGRGNAITPEASGIFTKTFAEDTVGIALTTSYSERENGVNSYNTSGWFTNRASVTTGSNAPDNVQQINRPSTDSDIWMSTPRAANYTLREYASTRLNGQLTLQWAPIETVDATLDYTYSEFELSQVYNSFGGWFNHNANTVNSTWETFGSHASPMIYAEVSPPSDNAMALGSDGNKNENNSVGLNVAWQARDNLRFVLDYHDSSAEKGALDPLVGTSTNLNISSYNRVLTQVDYRSELPVITIGMDSGRDPDGDGPLTAPARPLYASDMKVSGSVIGNEIARMDIEQTRFKGTFELSDVTSIDFGIESTAVENQGNLSNVQLDTWGGVGDLGQLDDILVRASMSDQFDQIDGSDNTARTTDFFVADADDIKAVARQIYVNEGLNYGENIGDCGDGYCPSTDWDIDRFTEETTESAYIQVNHSTELMIPQYGTFPLNIQAGIRHEQTDVLSTALAPIVTEVYTVGANEVYYKEGEQQRYPFTGAYDKTLPSLDMDITIQGDFVMRLSASKTITRPGWGSIRGGIVKSGVNYPIDTPIGARAVGGNPGLQPMLSTNLDLSTEWYYDDASYVSLTYFQKDVEDFIGTSFRYEELFGGVPDLEQSDVYKAVEAELNAEGTNTGPVSITSRILEDYNIEGTVAYQNAGAAVYTENGETRLRGVAGQGAPISWQIQSDSNQEDAKVDGIELNIQHNFGDTGFGMIVNATLVNANVAYDNNVDVNEVSQFVLNGLSDSANLVAFYDKDKLEARIAYNWRDGFLNGIGQEQGTNQNPTNVRSYGQIDLSANYKYSDNITIFFAGINVGESTYRVYGREIHQVLQMGQTGARYDFGMTYKF